MVQNPHHYPWRHAPSLASCSLTGAALPGGAPINAGRASSMGRILSEALRRGRPSADVLPRRCLGPSRDQRVVSFYPDLPGLAHGRTVVWAGRNSPQLRILTWSVALLFL